ncbi:sodium- and chloride-dependent taurine transporter [Strongylocentrotus purpuratus]|uniref:Transporter n=1 Tax=Strongylocentrotus purpuratus TaxID=7668 RepID=A0A7M7N237_STRPU|nr:sodium- and chloride-dependent taurine transporter [Strongylocentrotus purpuratus]
MSDQAVIDRERWSWRFESIGTNIGFVACFQNLWRFPYLCYANGGFLFLIPYLLCSMFLAIPLMFLETALGQYTSSGPIRAWKICPLFQGIGVATTVVAWWRTIYHNVILAWTLYYLYSSCLGGELPWTRCNNVWNTPSCLESSSKWVCVNGTYIIGNKWDTYPTEAPRAPSWNSWDVAGSSDNPDRCAYNSPATTNPAQEFWKFNVLQQTDGIHDVGRIVWYLALNLFLAWKLIYFGLWMGVKLSGKIAYFTVPYIHLVLAAFFIRGVTLPGAYDGLRFFLYPNIYLLGRTQVWIAAGTEVFYSFSIGLGAFTALGSFNKFHYNFYRDSMIVAYLNVITSIYGVLIVSSFVGFVATTEGIPVNGAVNAGPGLIFEVFPRAFAAMPSSRVSAIFFFLVVLTIVLNSQLVMVGAFITSVLDLFPTSLRIGYYKGLFVLGVCFVNFLIGLSMVTQGGLYVFTLFSNYGDSAFPIVWICFFESIAIGWFYGVRRFSRDIAEMLKWQQIEWYIICWPVTVPIIALLVWIGNIVYWAPLSYFPGYPRWADGLGFCMTLSSMVCIPAGAVYSIFYHMIKGEGPTMTRLKKVIQPTIVPFRYELHVEPDGVEMT